MSIVGSGSDQSGPFGSRVIIGFTSSGVESDTDWVCSDSCQNQFHYFEF